MTNPRRSRNTVEGSVVYFVATRELNRVKIGRTRDMDRRFRALCGGFPGKLELLGTIPGGSAVEEYLHILFAAHSTSGEWFELVPEIEEVALSGELPVRTDPVVDGAIGIGMSYRFALIEQALSYGIFAPTQVTEFVGCTREQLEDAVGLMRRRGHLMGSRSPTHLISAAA